ncbi:uncharacterized protein LOC129615873 isoform X2 [Condylostylus longicornis]|uniref:uncharacterized protein LOC129615873 isoform X2 n=1 Tax=Condylostylus longicornis TaxID=2530218 RepID=UPI00244DD306|nr:uncharacterized protein LOC129615873 isoform X2 [Condylostylus longicornis]
MKQFKKTHKMHGVKRVIVFCILIVLIPSTLIIIPLYLRHSIFADVVYPVAESDIIEIRDGISSIFCQKHTLHMDSNFNAFQLSNKPEISTNRKHIRLKKSMVLPDDTLEYWGFYLLKGAKVELKFCSRYDGSRILVVKGERNLQTCGLLEHNKNKVGTNFAEGHDKVKVIFEDKEEFNMSKEHRNKTVKHETGDVFNLNIIMNHPHKENLTEEELENNGGEDLSEINEKESHLLDTSTIMPKIKRKYPNQINKTELLNNGKNINLIFNTTTKSNVEILNETGLEANENDKEANKKHTLHNINFPALEPKRTRIDFEKEYATRTKPIKHYSSNIESPLNKKDGENNNKKEKDESNVRRRRRRHHMSKHDTNKMTNSDMENEYLRRKKEREDKKKKIYHELYGKISHRTKREHVYDRKISHGGNALNFTEKQESNSISSFENSLLTCYDGKILVAEGFPPSQMCTNVHYLATMPNVSHMITSHEVTEDGYYYYIFYSDNDLVRNDIHAIFDIFKPTFLYSNISSDLASQNCINTTNCTFNLNFYSDEYVVVEVPTRDGIEHDEDDITYLYSTCHPRSSVYVIFPIAVLVLILSCAFL